MLEHDGVRVKLVLELVEDTPPHWALGDKLHMEQSEDPATEYVLRGQDKQVVAPILGL